MIHVAVQLLFTSVLAVNFYEHLQVSSEATEREIEMAYEMLLDEYSPENNPGDKEMAKKYSEIIRAYEVLSDATKRQVFDLKGYSGLNNAGNFNKKRGPDYKYYIKLTLEEIYMGMTKDITVQRNEICKECAGTGALNKKTKTCNVCNGRGYTTKMQKNQWGQTYQMQYECDKCKGEGIIIPEKCPKCDGKKVKRLDHTVTIDIPAGAREGHEIKFNQAGERSPNWFPGSVTYIVKEARHNLFERQNNDLKTTINLSLSEALLGFKRSIPHLKGEMVEIVYEGTTSHGAVRKVKGEGLPVTGNTNRFGDLIITYMINYPRSVTATQKQAIEENF